MNGETSGDVSVVPQTHEASAAAHEAARRRIVHVDGPPVGTAARRWRLHRLSVFVVLLGLAITAALTVTSELSYQHNEQRLTTLQASLTASLLKTVPVQIEGGLGRVAGVVAEASDPVATFRTAIAPLMAPTGSYASASLTSVDNGQAEVLDHVGTPSIRSPETPDVIALFERAAASSTIVTTRAVGDGIQKLGYLVSAHGPSGTYVVSVSQQLPVGRRVTVPAGSPDADLNFAIYFGRSTSRSALVETNLAHLPLTGTVSQSQVPFGSSMLTLVVSPRGPLSGRWSELLPWGILVVGVLLTTLVVGMTERLIRRRAYAESLAIVNRRLYGEQRDVSLTLQRALLPRELPSIPGVDLAARYIPSAAGAEVGGDWYSVVAVDATRFAFVVGDVSGHGVAAASVMGVLRYTVRTLAKVGFAPADILDRANREIDVATDHHFATVLVGLVDMATSEMILASAGHLRPLLIQGPNVAYVEVPIGLPLGVSDQAYVSVALEFPPGSTLVAFTDGLVEDRSEVLDTGLRRLADVASSASGSSSDGLLNAILARLASSVNQDDIAILAIRR